MIMGRRRKTDTTGSTGDSPATGHNSGELTDDQKQVLWFQRKKRIASLKTKIASLTGELRAEYKGLKAELGITRADADFALALGKDDDDKMLEQERRRRMLARWEGHAIGTQSDLFDDDRTPAVDAAFADGKRAGLAGERCENPFDPSTEQYREFQGGYHEGQAALAANGIKKTPLESFAHEAAAEGGAADLRPGFLQRAEAERASEAVDSLAERALTPAG
jgi:hypothetical protein